MRARGAALALPAAAFGGLAVQAYRAAHAPVPCFDDLDVTGEYGSGGGRPLRIAVLGDSTLTGPGLDDAAEVFVARAAARLPQRVRLEQHAVGGSRVRDVLDRQLPAVLGAPPELAVLSVGANDAIHGTPTRRAGRDLAQVLMALAAARVRIVACGIIDLSVLPRVPKSLRRLVAARGAAIDRELLRAVGRHVLALHVPASELVGGQLRDGAGALFSADRFHPNAAGHAVLADACYPFLAEAVSRAVVDRVIARVR